MRHALLIAGLPPAHRGSSHFPGESSWESADVFDLNRS